MARQQFLLEAFHKHKRPRIDYWLNGCSLIDFSDNSDSDTKLHEDSTQTNSEMDIMPLNKSNDLILENDEEPMNQANLPPSTSQSKLLEFGVIKQPYQPRSKGAFPKRKLGQKNQSIVPFSLLGLIISCGRNGSTGK